MKRHKLAHNTQKKKKTKIRHISKFRKNTGIDMYSTL